MAKQNGSSEDPPDLLFLPLLRRVQVDHCGFDVAVPEEARNRLELRAVVKEIRRAGVPEFVRRELHAEQRLGATPDHVPPRPRNERLTARVEAVATSVMGVDEKPAAVRRRRATYQPPH